MATSTPYLLFICICAVYALRRVSSSSISMCPHQSSLFINALRFQCPLSFPPNSPLQVDGDFLDRTLTSIRGNVQTSVLFYASWCPFSRTAHSKFEALASMFPQIDHLAVEQSSAMPSVISRYGIHGLPTILIVNQTSRTRFCGSKDLRSLVKFYEKTTGFWVSFVSHFNMEMFGGGSQILGRVVHLIDAKRAWTKLKLCKTRNFHDGAKNARVWASSLTSVSLGEASSSRSCS
ncbi:5'-adenylylsulfate reductase-like 5 isoform X2 [Cornus florida]|uniref:5'-adenylylsulfate reductase-like 5 isoform X2 n=1 Tax=Cornus florida TaxID=4283 RepID=UPI00289B7B96|nr:5'-adenylylsulfate reductase-like 5 isoform X2 [Cornus florida]